MHNITSSTKHTSQTDIMINFCSITLRFSGPRQQKIDIPNLFPVPRTYDYPD